MPEVKMNTPLPASVSEVWTLIGQFNALPQWHPAVESSEMEEGGTVRRLKLVGGGEIVERLEAHNDGDKAYTYSIISGPLPVQNYTATLRVKEGADGKAVVEWSSNFDPVGSPDDAMKAIQGVYATGFANLQKMFGMS